MNRRLILLPVLLLSCTAAMAIPETEDRAFLERDSTINADIDSAYARQDWARCSRLYSMLVRNIETLPFDRQEKYLPYKAEAYYRMAGMESLLGRRRQAVRNLEIARQNGFNDYYALTEDTAMNLIRGDARFKAVLRDVRETGDYLYILKKGGGYKVAAAGDSLPTFTYETPNSRDLVSLRAYFNLDSVAGCGDELSKIKNIMAFVHNTIRHDGTMGLPPARNAIDMYEACADGSRGLNCRGLAIMLNECYLAMGFNSRFVTCMPKTYVDDCHVINAVYSNTLDKWLWMDPTNNAWVTDTAGNMLSVSEVRQYLIEDKPVMVNEEANWNNRNKTTTKQYLYRYMAKNLYCLECWDRSCYNIESLRPEERTELHYVILVPEGHKPDTANPGNIITSDPEWFWQSPYE